MIAGILHSYKRQRVETKLKRAHAYQRTVRQELRDLEAAHRKGDVAPDEFERKKNELEAKRSELTNEVNALLAEQERLEAAA